MLVQCVHEFLHVCRKITPITISQIIKSDIYCRHQNKGTNKIQSCYSKKGYLSITHSCGISKLSKLLIKDKFSRIFKAKIDFKSVIESNLNEELTFSCEFSTEKGCVSNYFYEEIDEGFD